MFLAGEKNHASRYPKVFFPVTSIQWLTSGMKSHPVVLLEQEASQTVTFTTETQKQKLVAPIPSRASLPKTSTHPLFFSDHLLLSQVLSSAVQGEKRRPPSQ